MPHRPAPPRLPITSFLWADSLALAPGTGRTVGPSTMDGVLYRLRLLCATSVFVVALSACSQANIQTSDPDFTPLDVVADSPTSEPTPSASPTGVTAGKLAPGFPSSVLPLPRASQILLSSAVPAAGDAVTISLNLRSQATVAELTEHYDAALTEQQFALLDDSATPAGLAAQMKYARADGNEILTIGILDDGDARVVTIGGQIASTNP